ncbi:hypothetical protein [Idiomarina sp. HP20-50]|uniref:hypothetical protein n=1 Tax=Idiomarina sp. HP20-50 TaxID=3070813 RepID=UPI00294B1C72|nr:hypothetical protein [Idiomarina sp. HP20-50]MDV6315912.1 hypothetical protein [Idiomarina sp. HP20-50]
MKLLIENSDARRLIEANCNLAISIAQLAEYIESDSLNKFGLVEIIKSLRDEASAITSSLQNNIVETDETKDMIELTLLAAAKSKLFINHFGYCCREEDLASCLKKSGDLNCVRHP